MENLTLDFEKKITEIPENFEENERICIDFFVSKLILKDKLEKSTK